jgi:hypothetical protein
MLAYGTPALVAYRQAAASLVESDNVTCRVRGQRARGRTVQADGRDGVLTDCLISADVPAAGAGVAINIIRKSDGRIGDKVQPIVACSGICRGQMKVFAGPIDKRERLIAVDLPPIEWTVS